MGGTNEPAAGEGHRIARAAGVVSAATGLSRVLGVVRDVVLAWAFGAGGALDAFFVAFRLPNTLRRLFAEGSLTVAFVPVFVEVTEREGRGSAMRLGRRVLTLLAAVLTGVSALGVVGAPWIVRAIAAGFGRDPAKFALTVELTRWVFPYIALIGLTALAGGMLNAWNVFGPPALAPVVLNVCLIVAALGLAPFVDPPILALAAGVLAGGVWQLALQIRALGALGFRFRPDWAPADRYIRRILGLMGPAVFGVAVYQVNILVSTFLASWLPDGSVSYLYYAERLFQLPLGLFAVAVGTAALPSLSRLRARGDHEGFRRTLEDALAMTGLVVLPAAAGLAVLAGPVVGALFGRGAFGPAAVDATARALVAYAGALAPVAGVRVLAPAFYSLGDTRTPVKASWWAFWVNLGASLALMVPLKHVGLALATGVSSAFNLAYLAWALGRRGESLRLRALGRRLAPMAAGSVGMAAAVAAARPWLPGGGGVGALLAVLGLVAAGAVLYVGLARVLGAREVGQLLAVASRRLGRG